MALASLGNAVNRLKQGLGISKPGNNPTGSISTSGSRPAGIPANSTGSGGARQVVKAGQRQSDEYNRWANEQVVAGLRNKTYGDTRGGSPAVYAGRMYGQNKNFAGNVVTNESLISSTNPRMISKLNAFNRRVGRNEVFAVVDGKTTPLSLRRGISVEAPAGLKSPIDRQKWTSYNYYATPSGQVVTQNSLGQLTASPLVPNSPLRPPGASYTPRGDVTVQGLIQSTPLRNTRIGNTAVRYITGNQGEFGYTNKNFDTTYSNEAGTLRGALREGTGGVLNVFREVASAGATANRYRFDRKARPLIENYVTGTNQSRVSNQSAAGLIREAYNAPGTAIFTDDKTGGQYIYVKTVRVPLDIAERAASEAYGNDPRLLQIAGGDGKWRSRADEGINFVNRIIDPAKDAGRYLYQPIQPAVNAIDDQLAQTVPLYSPFRRGVVEGTNALIAFPGAAARTVATSIDLLAEAARKPNQMEALGTLYGAADAEIASRFVDPLYSSLQESDYSPSDVAFFAGGFVPDLVTGKLSSVIRNRAVLPAKTYLGAAADNVGIARRNMFNPLRSEADVAAHASKMLGVPVDFATVQDRLPGVYKPTERGYKINYARVEKPKIKLLVAGDNISNNRIEQRLLRMFRDSGLNKFGSTRHTADYLQRYWGNPTKFFTENEPRRFRNFLSERIEGLQVDPIDVYSKSVNLGMSPLDAADAAVKQIDVNRRLTRISDFVGIPFERSAKDTVKLVIEKKKFADERRRRYGDFVSRTDIDDVAEFTSLSPSKSQNFLHSLGMSDRELGIVRSLDEMMTFEGVRPPDSHLRVRERGTAVVPTERGILVVQERNGLWNLPGGGVNKRETVESGVLRELNEETGLQGKNPRRLFDVAGNPWKDSRGRKNVNLNEVFIVDDIVGTPIASNEISKIGYYTPDSDLKLGGSAKKILDAYYKNTNPSPVIPDIPKSKNLYGIHATSKKLPSQTSVMALGRSESPVLYIGMDTMGATGFLRVDHKFSLIPRFRKPTVPSIETVVLPSDVVAQLDTPIRGRSGKVTTIRRSFDTEPENVFIGKTSDDSKRIFQQYAEWNEEIIPAAKRQGYVASQLPKYGENAAGDLIEHEIGIYDETLLVRNPWVRNFTFYKGRYIDLPERIYAGNTAIGSPAPDLSLLPTAESASTLSEKVSRARAREEYVFRGETRRNKITGKETPLIPVSREISKKEFNRLTRPGYFDSAKDIGYDLLRKRRERALSPQPDTPRFVDPSFNRALSSRTTIRSGWMSPLSSALRRSQRSAGSSPSVSFNRPPASRRPGKSTPARVPASYSVSSAFGSSIGPRPGSSGRPASSGRPGSSSRSNLPKRSAVSELLKPVKIPSLEFSDGNPKTRKPSRRTSEKDRTLLGIRRNFDFKDFRI